MIAAASSRFCTIKTQFGCRPSRYFALAAIENGILHTAIGPREGHMQFRDLDYAARWRCGARYGAAAECAGARIVSVRGTTCWQAGCIAAQAEHAERHNE